eukprot:scaffold1541_cov256-Pinguiococcus_pyrenoidosus.AAC.40
MRRLQRKRQQKASRRRSLRESEASSCERQYPTTDERCDWPPRDGICLHWCSLASGGEGNQWGRAVPLPIAGQADNRSLIWLCNGPYDRSLDILWRPALVGFANTDIFFSLAELAAA